MKLDVNEEDMIDDADDPASRAFRKLKREVGMMRLAVEKLADEPGKIEIPDYTETLAEMAGHISGLGKGVKALQSSPALSLTPDQMTRQIVAAGAEARKIEQTAMADATGTFVKYAEEMASFVTSARTEEQQNKWLLWMGIGGLISGAIMMAILLGPVARAIF